MSGSRLISAFGLAVIFSQISAIISADIVPVVILGGKPPKSQQSIDALRVMTTNEFADVVWNKVGGSRSPIVLFTKDNLCVEDLSQAKLQFDTHSNFYPSVVSPQWVLENMESYNISKEDKTETISDGELLIRQFENLAVVPEMYTELHEKNPKLVGVIAGASCSYSRSERTRRAATAKADNEVIAQSDRVLLYASQGIHFKIPGEKTFHLLGQPTNVSTMTNATNNVRFDMTFAPNTTGTEVTLRLQFTGTASKYWYFESIEYETGSSVLTLANNNTIYFPYNFSYHCAKDTVFYSNQTTYVYFDELQVQIDPTISATAGTAVFSDGYDCIGFTTIPILSTIFVTAILALILIWAVTMIMDIRTMDRFDDPKGKTITIAVAE